MYIAAGLDAAATGLFLARAVALLTPVSASYIFEI
jgi:hypothetical protein